MSDSLPAGAEPTAKRVRTEDEGTGNNIMEVSYTRGVSLRHSAAELQDATPSPSQTPDILDWLIRDCLHIVFDYLSTKELLNSMTVSRRWRDEVLEYLRVSRFCFEFYYMGRGHYIPRLLGLIDPEDSCRRRTTPFSMFSQAGNAQKFRTEISTLGPCIVSMSLDCLTESSLKSIMQHCPNLEDLMLVGLQSGHRDHERHDRTDIAYEYHIPNLLDTDARREPQCPVLTFSNDLLERLYNLRLKRIAFVHSPIVSEDTISLFLKNDALEEIIVSRNRFVDGRCLSNVRAPHLKSLRLIGCSLETRHLSAIIYRLNKLTMLDLSNNPVEILQNVHLILDKTPNLEHLILNTYQKTNVGNEFVAALRRLSCLKHLALCWNHNVCDEWLEAAAAGCQELLTVDIEARQMPVAPTAARPGPPAPPPALTSRALLALCRGARELQHIGIAGQPPLAAQLPAYVTSCRALRCADLRGCALTPALLAAAGAAAAARGRAPPVTLRVARTSISKYDLAPEGLIYDLVDTPTYFRLV